MKRLVISAAFALTLFSTAGIAQAAPTPTPTPSPTPMPSASSSLDPNTAEVCEKSRATVNQGIDDFTKEITNAGTQAQNGDLQRAETAVKKSGTVLIDLASKLRTDAAAAQKPELKQALEDVATELSNLGGGLTSLTSLQNFDTGRLEALAQRVAEICGG
jgi:soluble cytochrome b562